MCDNSLQRVIGSQKVQSGQQFYVAYTSHVVCEVLAGTLKHQLYDSPEYVLSPGGTAGHTLTRLGANYIVIETPLPAL